MTRARFMAKFTRDAYSTPTRVRQRQPEVYYHGYGSRCLTAPSASTPIQRAPTRSQPLPLPLPRGARGPGLALALYLADRPRC